LAHPVHHELRSGNAKSDGLLLQILILYLSIRNDGSSSDIVVTVGDGDDPVTIVTGPTIVLPGGADFVDKNWLGVNAFDSADGVSDGGGYVYVNIAYYDHYRSTAAAPNRIYDVRYYRKSVNGGATFGGPVTVTDVVSLSDEEFIGGYFGHRHQHAAVPSGLDRPWTDILDFEDDVFADRY
jgi:hypothetical protein